MSTKDISRFLFQPRKRYSGVRMQQGRVILDSDWNESERIDDEQSRRTLVDLICSQGSSNRGFRVVNLEHPVTVPITGSNQLQTYNFSLENGSFYIGGLRFEIETEGGLETFLKQSDWLPIDVSAANLPSLPDPGTGGVRSDLVYLMGWEQCVSAVEDSELREVALGGPDTSVRVRRMRRIAVLPGVPDTCAAAFSALQAQLTAPRAPDTGAPHTFDLDACELKSKARLTVTLNPGDLTEDPCKPSVPGGYLGADNQTLRVQLTATNRFIWGYDNASPFYRVQVEDIPDVPAGVDGTRRKVRFLTHPRDQAAQPLAGQAVEIVPWGALLPNFEKVAEFQGKLFTVESSFDPEDGSLTLTEAVPLELVQWLADHPSARSPRDDVEAQQYLYLRVWTGGSGNATAPDHGFTPGAPVDLSGTGLRVVFSAHGLPGDYWIVAARPNTPDRVVPWDLLDSAPPAGPRFFFAPLALIRWSVDASGTLVAALHDCRERFRPLCDARGCCSVTVGDGVSSHGDFDSLEEAIEFLPDAGGEVCLLPGQHRANATLKGRRKITIHGCDKQTRVIPRAGQLTQPILRIDNGQQITLRDLELVTFDGSAVVIESSERGQSREIYVTHNRILAFAPAIQVRRGVDIHIVENRIRMLDKRSADVAIQILAEDSVIERNDIGVVPAAETPPGGGDEDPTDPTDPCVDPEIIFARPPALDLLLTALFTRAVSTLTPPVFKARGGIQVVAGSERITIRYNVVRGGAGDGVLLGGALPAEPEDPPLLFSIETLDERFFKGNVLFEGVGQAGIVLMLTRDDGTTLSVATQATQGFFRVRTPPGKYALSLASAGFEIQKVQATDTLDGRFHRIDIVKLEQPIADDSLAFLYEIQIDDNEISRMGLSGIGHPIVTLAAPPIAAAPPIVGVRSSTAAALLAETGTPVMTLGIHRNHIHDCLQSPIVGSLRDEAQRRGFGGISLGYCEDVAIDGNRIEKNGTAHVMPVCGIFIRWGEKVDIHHNHIADNGPFVDSPNSIVDTGVRGGIVLLASALGIDDGSPPSRFSLGASRHAARIHDNIVHQPMGQALRLIALGTSAICDNRWATELAGPEGLELLAGTLLVFTLGALEVFPGLTSFNANQTSLGPDARCFTAQFILTTDDLGFSGNQSAALTNELGLGSFFLLCNTLLLGRTLRASDSRFMEPGTGEGFRVSLMTLSSLLNNTQDNHGDHCIFAFNSAVGRAPRDLGNQVIDAQFCRGLGPRFVRPMTEFTVNGVFGRA